MHDQLTVATLVRRDRIIIAACIAGVAALAWAYLIHLSREMSSSMAYAASMAAMGMATMSSWNATDVVLTWLMWSVMMIGMMVPATTPLLMLFAEMETRRVARRVPLTVIAFAAGYFILWFGFSAVAALVQSGLNVAAILSPATMVTSGRVGGVVLIAAGIYQLTPAKNVCLRHCQSPLGFLMSRWRDGIGGAFRMGLRHGIYCLGCCWAVMGVLFVVGVMNLAWVGVLTAFILLERSWRSGMIVARAGAAVMIAGGVFLIATGGGG